MISGQNVSVSCDISQFSVESYFSYVKLSGSRELNFATLKKIISHHNESFPYHNTLLHNAGKVSASERLIPSLDRDALFKDMVVHHGGYCFQQMELLYAVLSGLGFKLDRYIAKIILQPCLKMQVDDNTKIKTHELLMVYMDEKKYLIDSGMGNLCLREPLELKEGMQTICDDEYRLTKNENNRWALDTKNNKKHDWYCMYQFFDASVAYEEIVKHHNNLYLTQENRVIRDNRYLTGITTSKKRKCIGWFFNQTHQEDYGVYFSIKKDSDQEKKKTLGSFDEAKALSQDKFGIR